MPSAESLVAILGPQFNVVFWQELFAPAATPKPVIEKLNASLNQALRSPAVTDRMTKEGFDPIPSTPAEARARVEKELPQWAKLIKERGIKAE